MESGWVFCGAAWLTWHTGKGSSRWHSGHKETDGKKTRQRGWGAEQARAHDERVAQAPSIVTAIPAAPVGVARIAIASADFPAGLLSGVGIGIEMNRIM